MGAWPEEMPQQKKGGVTGGKEEEAEVSVLRGHRTRGEAKGRGEMFAPVTNVWAPVG